MSTLFLSSDDLAERRRIVARAAAPLAGLAASLAADLAPVIARPVWVPPNKARLTRIGGTCPRDGARLTFDPFAPRGHRCPTCGTVYDRLEDYQWWTFGYQLWLAERAVHAAALALLANDGPHVPTQAAGQAPIPAPTHATAHATAHATLDRGALADFTARVLDAYTDAYLTYPNADNVLGPTRPFFSTYLESLWLVHVCSALDLLRTAIPGAFDALASRVCERVIEPSRALIAGFPEGTSNRQVWHAVARLASARMLGDTRAADGAVHGRWGISDLLGTALLDDGSWFEGENYHQFAHRGLWYGLRFAERAGIAIDNARTARFRAGYSVPFRVALPDGTLPARRDAQYAVSLRQWRWAEWCELGVADAAEPRVGSAVQALYAPLDSPLAHATGRWRATGESERNEPASALSRADLGWKSLLFARAELPSIAREAAPRSELLPAQGFAVLRRDAGRVYAALDFGGGGGGHGHPDRLNVILQDGDDRWLDDPGTGTYVERTLHWYRSTLAHAAPLVDGRSQNTGRGVLVGFDAGVAGAQHHEGALPDFAGVAARTGVAGVLASRALVASDTCVIDLLVWRAIRPCVVDLPFLVDGTLTSSARPWAPFDPQGGEGLEDGFDFVHDAAALAQDTASVRIALAPHDRDGPPRAALWLIAPATTLWRGVAPGPPGTPERRFHAVRMRGHRGSVAAVWDLRGTIASVQMHGGRIAVAYVDGTVENHDVPGSLRLTEAAAAGEWRIVRAAAHGACTEQRLALPGPRLARRRTLASIPRAGERPRGGDLVTIPAGGVPVVFALGASRYRRSEPSWEDAGAPSAVVRVAVADGALTIDVMVRLGRRPAFAPAGIVNPLDNERADVNSDGLQLAVVPIAAPSRHGSWLLVPEDPAPSVRQTRTDGHAGVGVLDARWRDEGDGWSMRCALALRDIPGDVIALDLAVNEKPLSRERRRGQLVLAEPDGAFVYLRGDRLDTTRALQFRLPPVAAAK